MHSNNRIIDVFLLLRKISMALRWYSDPLSTHLVSQMIPHWFKLILFLILLSQRRNAGKWRKNEWTNTGINHTNNTIYIYILYNDDYDDDSVQWIVNCRHSVEKEVCRTTYHVIKYNNTLCMSIYISTSRTFIRTWKKNGYCKFQWLNQTLYRKHPLHISQHCESISRD